MIVRSISTALYQRRSRWSRNFAGERRMRCNLEKMCGGEGNECTTTPKNGKEGEAWSWFWPQELEKGKKGKKKRWKKEERKREEWRDERKSEEKLEGHRRMRVQRESRGFSHRFFASFLRSRLFLSFTRLSDTRVNFWNLILSRVVRSKGRNHSHRSANESLSLRVPSNSTDVTQIRRADKMLLLFCENEARLIVW